MRSLLTTHNIQRMVQEDVPRFLKGQYPFSMFLYHTYVLQLENYSLRRFLSVALDTFSAPRQLRTTIIWTTKLKIIFGTALISFLAFLVVLTYFIAGLFFPLNLWPTVTFILFLLIFSPFFSLFLAGAVYVSLPLDRMMKQRIVARAKQKLASHRSHLTVIGITGSYGKTTMKDALVEVLREQFVVVGSVENKNTPLGIAEVIEREISESTEVFVVEMGAYERGDIRELASLVKPDIAILTGINEAHLERQGTIENTIATKFELVEEAREDALIILNARDVRVKENVEKYGDSRRVRWYGEGKGMSRFTVEVGEVDMERRGREVVVRDSETGKEEKVVIPFIAPYIEGVLEAVSCVAEELELSLGAFVSGIKRLRPAPHRLEVVEWNDEIIIIDDSYNATSDTVKAAIEVFSKFQDRRRIFFIFGVAEAGEKSADVHREIGTLLASSVDEVVLVERSVTPFIVEGLKKGGFDEGSIHTFKTFNDATGFIKETLRPGDAVLFGNDWHDAHV